MANKNELVFTLKFRTQDDQILEQSATTLKDIKKSISDLEDELANTDLGSEQWKELNSNLEDSKDALKQAEQASMSLGDKLGAIPGPIGQVVQGVKGLGTAFKALLANPIILVLTGIVAALTALYKAFASTKEGGEQLRQVSAALGAVMDVFRDILVQVAKVLIDIFTNPVESLKNFGKLLKENLINRFTGMLELIPNIGKAIGLLFKGEFAEAGKVAGDAVAKVALGVENFTDKVGEAGKAVGEYFNEAITEGKKAAQLEKQLQKIADAQRALNVERAKQDKIIAEAKLVYQDETKSLNERLAALTKAGELEQGLADKEANLAKLKYETIKAQNALSDSSAEALDREAQAAIEYEQAQQRSIMKRTELAGQVKALNAQAVAEEKATLSAIEKLRDEFYLTEADNEKEAALRAEETRAQAQLDEIDALKTTEEIKAELRAAAIEKSNKEVEKIQSDFRQREKDAELKALQDKFTLLSFDAEQNIEALKENLIAQTEVLLQNATLTADQRAIIEATLAQKLKEIDDNAAKQVEDDEQKKRDARYQTLVAYSSALSLLGEIAGAETQVGKAAAAAQALLNSFLAFTQVLADPTVPSFLKPILATGILIKGMQQQKQILSTPSNTPDPKVSIPRFAQGGIVGGRGDEDNQLALLTPGEAVINKRSVELFGPDLSRINQAGGGVAFASTRRTSSRGQRLAEMTAMNRQGRGDSAPIKTYVVSSEMTNQQQLDTAIKNRSTL